MDNTKYTMHPDLVEIFLQFYPRIALLEIDPYYDVQTHQLAEYPEKLTWYAHFLATVTMLRTRGLLTSKEDMEYVQDLKNRQRVIRPPSEVTADCTSELSEQLVNARRQIGDFVQVLEDKKRIVRDIDVMISGEEGAAKQASLIDLIAPIQELIAIREERSSDIRRARDILAFVSRDASSEFLSEIAARTLKGD